EIHHSKHHQAYINNLNAALEKHPELNVKTMDDLKKLLVDLDKVPVDIQGAVRNNGGGHFNHAFFWPLLKKNDGKKPSGKLMQALVHLKHSKKHLVQQLKLDLVLVGHGSLKKVTN